MLRFTARTPFSLITNWHETCVTQVHITRDSLFYIKCLYNLHSVLLAYAFFFSFCSLCILNHKMLKSIFYLFIAPSICVFSLQEEAPFSKCDAQLKSIQAIKDKCPFLGRFNVTEPASCCKMWQYENCLAKLIMSISECKPTRFALFLTMEELRKHSCDPETEKCAHNPTIGFVKDISENTIHPFNELFKP